MNAAAVELAGTWFRLIPSRFPPVSIYERVAPEANWAMLHEVETLTNPRVRERRMLTGTSRVDDASPRLQNWNHAPFAYLNPEGTWLLDPSIGALELSDSLQTALAASLRRRELFLGRTSEPPMDLDMRVLCTRVSGRFADLTGLDPSLNQAARWRLGEEILQSDVDGALFSSPYRAAGRGLAVFNAGVLARSLQAEHFRFVWDGTRIRSIYSFEDGTTLEPEDVCAADPMSRAA